MGIYVFDLVFFKSFSPDRTKTVRKIIFPKLTEKKSFLNSFCFTFNKTKIFAGTQSLLFFWHIENLILTVMITTFF